MVPDAHASQGAACSIHELLRGEAREHQTRCEVREAEPSINFLSWMILKFCGA